jgi:hypothetical protein
MSIRRDAQNLSRWLTKGLARAFRVPQPNPTESTSPALPYAKSAVVCTRHSILSVICSRLFYLRIFEANIAPPHPISPAHSLRCCFFDLKALKNIHDPLLAIASLSKLSLTAFRTPANTRPQHGYQRCCCWQPSRGSRSLW